MKILFILSILATFTAPQFTYACGGGATATAANSLGAMTIDVSNAGDKYALNFDEIPSSALVVAVQTREAVTYLTVYAKYRCMSTPGYANFAFVPAGENVSIYLLDNRDQSIAGLNPDLVLSSEELQQRAAARGQK